MKSKLIISLFQTVTKYHFRFHCFKTKVFVKESCLLVNKMAKPSPALHKITSRMFARHYDINDVT